MRHRLRLRLRLRLFAGQSAARAAAVSPFLRSPSARLAPLQVSKCPPAGGRDSAGPLGTAGEESGGRGCGERRARWAKPGFTPSGKVPGRLAWLAETRRSSGLRARISCAWILFRKMYFIQGVFFKAPPRAPCNAKCVLRGKTQLFLWALLFKTSIKLVLKSFPVKKLQIILNY